METRDLAPTEHPPQVPTPQQTAHVTTASATYQGLEEVWKVFPDAHPNAASPLPAPYPQLIPEMVQLFADEAYRARVVDLVRRDEQIMAVRAALAQVPQHPQLLPASSPERKAASPAVPASVWKYSAIALSTGGGVALTGYGIGAAAPGLAVIDDLLASAGQAVMSVAVVVLVIGVLLATLGGKESASSGTVVKIKRAVFKRNKFYG